MKTKWTVSSAIIGIILIQITLFSCHQEDPPVTTEVCKISHLDLFDGTEHLVLNMNFDGTTDKIVSYSATQGTMTSTIAYTYSGDKIVLNITSSTGALSQKIYELDEDGRVENIVNNATGDEWSYYYDDNGYLEEESYSDGDDSDKDYDKTYTYSNGNCVSELKEYGSGTIQTVSYAYYEDKLNNGGYFGHTDDWAFGLNAERIRSINFGKASKNLLKTQKIVNPFFGWNIKVEHSYTVNDKGYVSARVSRVYDDEDLLAEENTSVTYLCK